MSDAISNPIYISGEDYSHVRLPDETLPQREESNPLSALPAYFEFNQVATPENLGLFWKKSGKPEEDRLTASRYAGVMPLVGGSIPAHSFVTVVPRFSANAAAMLSYIMQSSDFYQNHCQDKAMITFASRTTKEWERVKFHLRDESVLFGTYRDAEKFSPSAAKGEQASDLNFAALQGIFEIMEFLPACQHVCQAMLKQQSIRREENLVGKMKGKLNLNKQIKYNIVTGRVDRNYCSYNQMSIDNRENRILKYALYLVGQAKSEYPNLLEEEFAFCQRALAPVTLTPCAISDFNGLKNNGVFQYYTPALEGAKKIISRISVEFGKAGTEKIALNKTVTPFFVQMDLLFELFCRAAVDGALQKINEAQSENDDKYHLLPYQEKLRLFPEKSQSNDPEGFDTTHIPDLVILNKDNKAVAVIDAKYSSLKNAGRERTFQIMAYMLRLNCNKGGFISPTCEKNAKYVEKQMNDSISAVGQSEPANIGFHLPIDVTMSPTDWETKLQTNLKKLLGL